jgi:peptide/nickel transport system permease protein
MDYLRRRVLTSVVVFAIAVNLDFILPRLVPGNAAVVFSSGHILPAQTVQLINARFGLDKPEWVQYLLFLKNIFTNWPPFFGFSFQYYPVGVSDLIASRAPWTILLVGASYFASLGLSYTLAGFSAIRKGSKFELFSLYSAIVFWSIPAFWFGMVAIWIFGVSLTILPISGVIGQNPGVGLDAVASVFQHAILPIAVVTLVMFGWTYVLLRGSAQEALESDYILAARARGVRERVIAFGYVMRNSILPIISLTGYAVAALISAAIFVEYVFSYAGLGDLLVDGITNRDYPVVEGVFFYVTLLVILLTLVGDFMLVRMDPRLRR